jgi:hypothetical protein
MESLPMPDVVGWFGTRVDVPVRSCARCAVVGRFEGSAHHRKNVNVREKVDTWTSARVCGHLRNPKIRGMEKASETSVVDSGLAILARARIILRNVGTNDVERTCSRPRVILHTLQEIGAHSFWRTSILRILVRCIVEYCKSEQKHGERNISIPLVIHRTCRQVFSSVTNSSRSPSHYLHCVVVDVQTVKRVLEY